jgi:CubicO group peptidase (beta-lactamase class C family)
MFKKIVLILLLISNYLFFGQNEIKMKVDSLLKKYEEPNSPGLSIGIIKNGTIIYNKSIGYANLEYGIKNNELSVFSIASVAKQFTAACIWSLINEHKINLEDNVQQYIPELPDYGHPLKIKHLLNHTSGIKNYHALMDLYGFDYDKEYYDNSYVLELLCRQKTLNNIPGEKVIYSNSGYTLLAIIIERVSGKNLHEFAKEKLFIPLDMQNTFVRIENNSVIKNKAVGYSKNQDGSFSQFPRTQISYGAGSMGSTISDMTKWSAIFNDPNSEFKDLSAFLTATEILASGEKSKYANGVMIDEYKGYQTIHHSGSGAGGQSQFITLPDLKLSIIIFTNLESINPTPISYQIIDLFTDNKKSISEKIVKKYNPNNKEMLSLTGIYQEINSDMRMEIAVQNDTLKFKGSQAKRFNALKPINKYSYCRLNNENVKYEFFKDNKHQDMIVFFGGTPFYFKKITDNNLLNTNLKEFIGKYYSEELKVTYLIMEVNNNLVLNFTNNLDIPLLAVQKDEFGNGNRTLYSFKRNQNNQINKLIVASQGSISNIEFIKI